MTQRILLVEDDVQLCQLMARILTASGYEVHTASTGPEAVRRAIEIAPFQMLITDIVLPGMDGSEVVSRLRPHQLSFEVLYISGYPDDTLHERGHREIGIRFLAKPFGPDALVTRARALLEGSTLSSS